ncbi:MAG: cytidylate kinase family protein [Oscillospiraceae bacterium]
MFQTQSQILEKMTDESSSIVMGRCGAYLFRNHPRHISFFLHADIKHKVERLNQMTKEPPEKIKKLIEKIHTYDSDIVFEACIFETVWKGFNTFEIPEWVFEAFNMPVESRCFDFQKMLFSDGRFLNIFGEGISAPDITKIETQMFFYFRACEFVDMGFEALHIGQEPLVGAADIDNGCYAKLLKMIRDYAKKHARRGVVLINAHAYPFDMRGPQGELLLDFSSQPSCLSTDPEDRHHLPSENDPQEAFVYVGNGIYQNHPGGLTPSGEQCETQSYFVEFDNFMPSVESLEQFKSPGAGRFAPWGFDEISWFANQPAWYRRDFLKYMHERVQSFDKNGFFEMPGLRTAYLISTQKQEDYFASSEYDSHIAFGDENTIRDIWIESKKFIRNKSSDVK